MNSKPTPCSALSLLFVLSSAGLAAGQQYSQPPRYTQPPPNYYNYQQPQRESPLDFIPRLGQKVGQAVRRVFYGEGHSGYSQPPSYGYSQPPARQYAPPSYPQPSYGQPQYQTPPSQPRYNYPPVPPPSAAPKSQPPAPTSKPSASKSTSSTRKYTPPKIEAPVKKSSGTSPKPAVTKSTPKKTESPPKPKEPEVVASRRSETAPKEEPPADFPKSSNSGSFLKGKKSSKPGRVISTYPPFKELDVTGLDSGSLALDPTTQKVFEVP